MTDIVELLTHPNCGSKALRLAVEILNREKGELRADNERLRALASKVCWFDWSSNDADAVAAIEELRRALEAKP